MTPQKQLFRHDPSIGQTGDCHRTAIACLLDIPVQDCPHFIGEYERRQRLNALGESVEEYSWVDEQEKFLNAIGYTLFATIWAGEIPLEDLLQHLGQVNPDRYYIMGGMSPRYSDHSVIGCGGELIWDPHPDDGFFIGPMSHGFWQIDMLLPSNMKRTANA